MAQRATRVYISAIAKAWAQLTDVQRSSWQTHPAAIATSPYHAYLSENANRYKHLDGLRYGHVGQPFYPTAIWPADLTGGLVWPGSSSITNLTLSVTHTFTVGSLADVFLFLYHYAPATGGWPTYPTTVHVFKLTIVGAQTHTIPNLPAGAGRLRLNRCTLAGATADSSISYVINPTA